MAPRVIYLLFLMLFPLWTQASIINYSVSNISDNTWEYQYSLNNDSLGFAIEEFTIFYELGVYENLLVTNSPDDWDSIVIQPDPMLPDDGFFDALALVVGLTPGDLLGGFSVQFEFLNPGKPGAQFFEILDPNDFSVLASGTTTLVPIPAAFLLMSSALGWLAFLRRS